MKGSNWYDNGIAGRATSYKVQLKQFYNMKSSLKKKKKKKKKRSTHPASTAKTKRDIDSKPVPSEGLPRRLLRGIGALGLIAFELLHNM